MKIHFYIRPHKAKANGEAPIYLRLTGNTRKEHSIGYSIDPMKWDKAGYRSKGRKPTDHQLNQHIQSIIGRLRQIETSFITQGKAVQVETILNTFLGKGTLQADQSLLTTYQSILEKKEATIGTPDGLTKTTVGRYKTVLKHLKEFLVYRYGVNDLHLAEFTYEHVSEFEHYLQTVKGIKNNTRFKHLSFFRQIIREAINHGKLAHDPFAQWKGKFINHERVRLTQAELDILQTKDLHTKRLDEVRDVFVFACYTGLAYIDVHNLTEEHLIEDKGKYYIHTYRQKTKSKCWIPLLPPAVALLDKYADSLSRRIEGRLLPSKSNQRLNSYIKEVSVLCGIEKHLTFHVARHTFATTVTLAQDVPLETVSEMLGHSNLKTTQHYAKMIQSKVDRDMEKLAKRWSKPKAD